MITTCRVWVPSKQKYTRFREMSCEQHRNILKCIDEDEDFNHELNSVMMDSVLDVTSIEGITVIDRFVIFLQIKIHSHNSSLTLSRKCPKCDTASEFTIDLNQVIERLAESVDRSFKTTLSYDHYTLQCDAPILSLEGEVNVDVADIDKNINRYLFSFITAIQIKHQYFSMCHITEDERYTLCSLIPFTIIKQMKESYIDVLHKTVADILLVTNTCSNTKCGDTLSLNFKLDNMLDAIKILFKDDNATNILGRYAQVSSRCHLDYSFYSNITPAELGIIAGMVDRGDKSSDPSDKPTDAMKYYDEHKNDPQRMVETPSEFM